MWSSCDCDSTLCLLTQVLSTETTMQRLLNMPIEKSPWSQQPTLQGPTANSHSAPHPYPGFGSTTTPPLPGYPPANDSPAFMA